MTDPDAPLSTYRLQFHAGFTLEDARALVPYLAELGVTHIYASGLPPVRDFPLLRWPTRAVVGTRAELFDRALQGIVAARADHARHLAFSMPLEPHLMAEDGFHPGPIVYAEWARLAAEAIAADFRQPD